MSVSTRYARLAAAGGAIMLSVLLAGCGGGDHSAGSAAPSSVAGVSQEHNDADIRFAQGMILHHQQAIEMADLAAGRAAKPEVKALATQIKSAQDPEIQQMTGFLRAWGAALPAAGGQHGGAAGHTGTGMMTPQQLDQLRGATDAEFDRMFLQLMIAHHQGAIADSQRELAQGVNPQAKQLATSIVASQSAEITRMQQLLQTA